MEVKCVIFPLLIFLAIKGIRSQETQFFGSNRARSPSFSTDQNRPLANEALMRTAKRTQDEGQSTPSIPVRRQQQRTSIRPVIEPTPEDLSLRPSDSNRNQPAESESDTNRPLQRNTPRSQVDPFRSTTSIPFVVNSPVPQIVTNSNRGQSSGTSIRGTEGSRKPESSVTSSDKRVPSSQSPPSSSQYSCGETITLRTIPTPIQSPGWMIQSKYPSNSTCVWTLKPPTESKWILIKLLIHYLELEEDVECKYDYLEISSGHSKRLCGTIKNKEVVFNSTSLAESITFVSDTNYEGKGFWIDVSILVDGCPPVITTSLQGTGVVTSPGFPGNYPDSTDCWTLIRVIDTSGTPGDTSVDNGLKLTDRNVTITLAFDFINMEPDEQCAYDFLEIFDGFNRSASSSSSLSPSSSIFVSRIPGHNLGRFCEYNNLDDLDKKPVTEESTINHGARIGHNPNPGSTTMQPVVSSTVVNQLVITSSGPEMLLHFKSDQLLNSKGFKGKYKVDTLERVASDNCAWKQDTVAQRIETPNYPTEYPANLDCSLTITAPTPNDKIVIVFESFHMETDANCSFDRLEIYDEYSSINLDNRYSNDDETSSSVDTGIPVVIPTNARTNGAMATKVDPRLPAAKPVRIICGRKSAKFKHVSAGPSIKLRFVSDNFAEYPGFSARYIFVQSRTSGQGPTGSPQVSSMKETDFEQVPSNTSVNLRSSILLSCKPRQRIVNESIIWIHNDKILTTGLYDHGQKLLIREFTVESIGRYICKYGNLSKEAFLTASSINSDDCSIIFSKRPKDAVVSEGDSHILECSAIRSIGSNNNNNNFGTNSGSNNFGTNSGSRTSGTNPGHSRIEIEWLKDGKRIQKTENKIEILSSGYLVISNMNRDDSGFYFCVASIKDHHGNQPDQSSNLPSNSNYGNPSHESNPAADCGKLTAAAHVNVNVRQNVEKICGRPSKGQPSKQKPSVDSYGKIVGGSDAQKGAFPWQVMFWDYKRKSFCGGALLNEKWIITAAHCFSMSSRDPSNQPPPSEVRLGRYDQSVLDEETQFVTKISEIRKHPGFNKETFDNDIALVKLEDHVPFNDFIKPICLGNNFEDFEDIFFKHRSLKMGHVTGWGQLKEGGPQPKFLQEIRVPIVPQASCKSSTSFNVTNNMFCAGYTQEIVGDACKGDSGGPFVAVHEDRWYLLGIVSWGEGCGRSGKYGFYTKVINYLDWIKTFIIL